jgi:hypothetical protein
LVWEGAMQSSQSVTIVGHVLSSMVKSVGKNGMEAEIGELVWWFESWWRWGFGLVTRELEQRHWQVTATSHEKFRV